MSGKMTLKYITEFDNLTGEEVTREMTKAELDQWNADRAEEALVAQEREAKIALREATLSKLGLTSEELAALL
jgi:phage regulator Rha-like protein